MYVITEDQLTTLSADALSQKVICERSSLLHVNRRAATVKTKTTIRLGTDRLIANVPVFVFIRAV